MGPDSSSPVEAKSLADRIAMFSSGTTPPKKQWNAKGKVVGKWPPPAATGPSPVGNGSPTPQLPAAKTQIRAPMAPPGGVRPMVPPHIAGPPSVVGKGPTMGKISMKMPMGKMLPGVAGGPKMMMPMGKMIPTGPGIPMGPKMMPPSAKIGSMGKMAPRPPIELTAQSELSPPHIQSDGFPENEPRILPKKTDSFNEAIGEIRAASSDRSSAEQKLSYQPRSGRIGPLVAKSPSLNQQSPSEVEQTESETKLQFSSDEEHEVKDETQEEDSSRVDEHESLKVEQPAPSSNEEHDLPEPLTERRPIVVDTKNELHENASVDSEENVVKLQASQISLESVGSGGQHDEPIVDKDDIPQIIETQTSSFAEKSLSHDNITLETPMSSPRFGDSECSKDDAVVPLVPVVKSQQLKEEGGVVDDKVLPLVESEDPDIDVSLIKDVENKSDDEPRAPTISEKSVESPAEIVTPALLPKPQVESDDDVSVGGASHEDVLVESPQSLPNDGKPISENGGQEVKTDAEATKAQAIVNVADELGGAQLVQPPQIASSNSSLFSGDLPTLANAVDTAMVKGAVVPPSSSDQLQNVESAMNGLAKEVSSPVNSETRRSTLSEVQVENISRDMSNESVASAEDKISDNDDEERRSVDLALNQTDNDTLKASKEVSPVPSNEAKRQVSEASADGLEDLVKRSPEPSAMLGEIEGQGSVSPPHCSDKAKSEKSNASSEGGKNLAGRVDELIVRNESNELAEASEDLGKASPGPSGESVVLKQSVEPNEKREASNVSSALNPDDAKKEVDGQLSAAPTESTVLEACHQSDDEVVTVVEGCNADNEEVSEHDDAVLPTVALVTSESERGASQSNWDLGNAALASIPVSIKVSAPSDDKLAETLGESNSEDGERDERGRKLTGESCLESLHQNSGMDVDRNDSALLSGPSMDVMDLENGSFLPSASAESAHQEGFRNYISEGDDSFCKSNDLRQSASSRDAGVYEPSSGGAHNNSEPSSERSEKRTETNEDLSIQDSGTNSLYRPSVHESSGSRNPHLTTHSSPSITNNQTGPLSGRSEVYRREGRPELELFRISTSVMDHPLLASQIAGDTCHPKPAPILGGYTAYGAPIHCGISAPFIPDDDDAAYDLDSYGLAVVPSGFRSDSAISEELDEDVSDQGREVTEQADNNVIESSPLASTRIAFTTMPGHLNVVDTPRVLEPDVAVSAEPTPVGVPDDEQQPEDDSDEPTDSEFEGSTENAILCSVAVVVGIADQEDYGLQSYHSENHIEDVSPPTAWVPQPSFSPVPPISTGTNILSPSPSYTTVSPSSKSYSTSPLFGQNLSPSLDSPMKSAQECCYTNSLNSAASAASTAISPGANALNTTSTVSYTDGNTVMTDHGLNTVASSQLEPPVAQPYDQFGGSQASHRTNSINQAPGAKMWQDSLSSATFGASRNMSQSSRLSAIAPHDPADAMYRHSVVDAPRTFHTPSLSPPSMQTSNHVYSPQVEYSHYPAPSETQHTTPTEMLHYSPPGEMLQYATPNDSRQQSLVQRKQSPLQPETYQLNNPLPIRSQFSQSPSWQRLAAPATSQQSSPLQSQYFSPESQPQLASRQMRATPQYDRKSPLSTEGSFSRNPAQMSMRSQAQPLTHQVVSGATHFSPGPASRGLSPAFSPTPLSQAVSRAPVNVLFGDSQGSFAPNRPQSTQRTANWSSDVLPSIQRSLSPAPQASGPSVNQASRVPSNPLSNVEARHTFSSFGTPLMPGRGTMVGQDIQSQALSNRIPVSNSSLQNQVLSNRAPISSSPLPTQIPHNKPVMSGPAVQTRMMPNLAPISSSSLQTSNQPSSVPVTHQPSVVSTSSHTALSLGASQPLAAPLVPSPRPAFKTSSFGSGQPVPAPLTSRPAPMTSRSAPLTSRIEPTANAPLVAYVAPASDSLLQGRNSVPPTATHASSRTRVAAQNAVQDPLKSFTAPATTHGFATAPQMSQLTNSAPFSSLMAQPSKPPTTSSLPTMSSVPTFGSAPHGALATSSGPGLFNASTSSSSDTTVLGPSLTALSSFGPVQPSSGPATSRPTASARPVTSGPMTARPVLESTPQPLTASRVADKQKESDRLLKQTNVLPLTAAQPTHRQMPSAARNAYTAPPGVVSQPQTQSIYSSQPYPAAPVRDVVVPQPSPLVPDENPRPASMPRSNTNETVTQKSPRDSKPLVATSRGFSRESRSLLSGSPRAHHNSKAHASKSRKGGACDPCEFFC